MYSIVPHRPQTSLAQALDVSDRQVRRWVAGDRIPAGVWTDLARLMQERAMLLDKLSDAARELGPGNDAA